jgi:hypothetical protein
VAGAWGWGCRAAGRHLPARWAAPSIPPIPARLPLQERLAALEAENRDLRTELDAFDPQFFEEIEDMKHEHHQLTMK